MLLMIIDCAFYTLIPVGTFAIFGAMWTVFKTPDMT